MRRKSPLLETETEINLPFKRVRFVACGSGQFKPTGNGFLYSIGLRSSIARALLPMRSMPVPQAQYRTK